MFWDFLGKLFSFFDDSANPNVPKKRRLKHIARNITANRYSKFYKPKSGEAGGALGNFFYEVYKIIFTAQAPLRHAARSALLKQIVVESFLAGDLAKIKERLTEIAIWDRADNEDAKELINSVNDDLAVLSAAFDSRLIKAIDQCYANILCVSRFARFDYITLLKKFDSGIMEQDFSYKPRFSAEPGINLSAELKEFIALSFWMDPSHDWKNILRTLKMYRNGVDVVDYTQWLKLLDTLWDVNKSSILELMIRHIDEDPDWQFKPKLQTVPIAEKYLEDKQAEIKTVLDKVVAGRRKTMCNELVGEVFGIGVEVQRTRYYTEKAGEIYRRKNCAGFYYAVELNYLMAFLMDIFKPEFIDICNLLIVQGKCIVPEFSREMSEYVYLLVELTDKLHAFDETFSESGINGSRLKTLILKVDQGEVNRRLVTSILNTANGEVLTLIDAAVRSIDGLSKNLNTLLKDRQSSTHALIINWQELDDIPPVPLTQRITVIGAKIDAITRLIHFLRSDTEEQHFSDIPIRFARQINAP